MLQDRRDPPLPPHGHDPPSPCGVVWWYGGCQSLMLYKGCMNKYKAYLSVCRSKKGSVKRLETKRVQWIDEAYLIAIVLRSISSPLWWWCAADIASKEGRKEERKKGREGERKEKKEKGRRERRKEEGKEEGRRERRRKDEGKSSSSRFVGVGGIPFGGGTFGPWSRNIYIHLCIYIYVYTHMGLKHMKANLFIDIFLYVLRFGPPFLLQNAFFETCAVTGRSQRIELSSFQCCSTAPNHNACKFLFGIGAGRISTVHLWNLDIAHKASKHVLWIYCEGNFWDWCVFVRFAYWRNKVFSGVNAFSKRSWWQVRLHSHKAGEHVRS